MRKRINKVYHEIITRRYVPCTEVCESLSITMDKLKFLVKKITGHEIAFANGKVSKISVEEYEMVKRMVEFQKRGFGLVPAGNRLGLKVSVTADEISSDIDIL